MKHFYFLRSSVLCLLALVLTATTARAELIFQESFDYTAGQLSAGKKADRNNNLTNWWSLASWSGDTPTEPIQVTAGSLSYTDYSTGASNKAQLSSVNGTCDARYFSETTSGTLFLSAVINIASVGTTEDYFLGFSDGGSTYYGKIYAVAEGSGYKLSAAKSTELKTDITFSSTYNFNENILIVVEYEFVEGTKNDKVNLYINPTKEKPATATIAYNSTLSDAKTDPSKLAAVFMRQRTSTPAVAIDEIKVATAWADLFPASSGEGDGGETTKTPEIISSESILTFGDLIYNDETYTATFTVSGKNLTDDITLESDNSEVTLSHSTISKNDAEAEGGVTVTATLKPVSTGAKGSVGITLKSNGADDVVVSSSWAANNRVKVANIAALKEAEKSADENTLLFLTGEVVVSYIEKPSSTKFYYIEDATGAARLDELNTITVKSGDKIKDISLWKNTEVAHSFYIFAEPTIVSNNNEITPQVVTLKELTDNGADYLWELVKVEGVTLDKTEAQFVAGQNKISQDGTTINVNLTSDNTLVGTEKPAKADVVGISYYGTGLVIRARTAADITAKTDEGPTTAIATAQNGEMLCYSADGLLHIDNATSNVAIYSLTGICVARLNAAEHIVISLPQGIYAVKTNDITTKVVVK